jgi:hypothetical protein
LVAVFKICSNKNAKLKTRRVGGVGLGIGSKFCLVKEKKMMKKVLNSMMMNVNLSRSIFYMYCFMFSP